MKKGRKHFKIIRKDVYREIKKSAGRFISLFLIVALGVAFYAGIRSCGPDMLYSADKFYDDYSLMDIRVVSTLGLTDDDVNALEQVDGVSLAVGCYSADLLCRVGDESHVVKLMSLAEGINEVVLKEGSMPEAENECILDEQYMDEFGYEIGDTITLLSGDEETDLEDVISISEFVITGIFSSPRYLSFELGSTSIGSGSIEGLVMVNEGVFAYDYYTEIDIIVEGAADLLCYSDEYEELIEGVIDNIEEIKDEAVLRRYDEIIASYQEEIDEAQAEFDEEAARAQEEIEDARLQIEEAQAELESAFKELDAAFEALEEARRELDEGLSQLSSAQAQADEAAQEIAAAQEEADAAALEIAAAREEAQEAAAQLEAAQSEVDAGQKEADAARSELDALTEEAQEAAAQLEAAQQQLDEAKEQLDSMKEGVQAVLSSFEELTGLLGAYSAYEYENEEEAAYDWALIQAASQQFYAALSGEEYAQIVSDEILALLSSYNNMILLCEGDKTTAAQLYASGLEIYSQLEEAADTAVNQAQEQIDEGEQELEAAKAEAEAGMQELAAAQAQLDENQALLDAAQAEIDASLAQLGIVISQIDASAEELAAALAQIAAAKEELDASQAQIDASQAYLDEQLAEYEEQSSLADENKELADENQEQLDEKAQQLEEESESVQAALDEAQEEIDEAQVQLEDVDEGTWYILDRSYLEDYSSYWDDARKIENIGKVFPVIFFIVAALVCLTTMTRMVDEERTQIGTLKALGYSKWTIMGKYIKYALIASLAGSLAGAAAGSVTLPLIIINVYKLVYENLEYILVPINWNHCIAAAVLMLVCIMAATLASSLKSLMEVPANLMRPASPKKARKLLLERIRPLWHIIPFGWKNALRNFVRYKKRLFMTLFGICGSTALLLVGFGLQDCINSIVDAQYGMLHLYDETLTLNTDASEEELQLLYDTLSDDEDAGEYMSLYITSSYASAEGVSGNLSCYIYVPEDMQTFKDFVVLRDRISGESVEMDTDTVVVSEKMADTLSLEVGDTFEIGAEDEEKKTLTVGGITENYVYNNIFMSKELYEELFGENVQYNQILILSEEGRTIEADEFGEKYLALEAVSGVSNIASAKEGFEEMLSSLDTITLVLIICAGALAFIVLFNLTNINISERKRELATLKVLGFYDMELSAYIYRENLMITVLGIAIGLFIGRYLSNFVTTTVEVDMVMFGREIFASSYILSALIAFAFAVIVNIIVHFKLKKIDMATSLKSVE